MHHGIGIRGTVDGYGADVKGLDQLENTVDSRYLEHAYLE